MLMQLLVLTYALLHTDFDECDNEDHNCDRNAVCNNTVGSYTCTCNDGYEGEGYNGSCRGMLIHTSFSNSSNIIMVCCR